MKGLAELLSTIHKKKLQWGGEAGFAVLVNAVWSCTLVKQHNVQPGHSCLLRAAGTQPWSSIYSNTSCMTTLHLLTDIHTIPSLHLAIWRQNIKKILTHALVNLASQTEFSLTLLLVQPLLGIWGFSMQRKSFPSPFCSLSLCVLGSRGTEKGEAL